MGGGDSNNGKKKETTTPPTTTTSTTTSTTMAPPPLLVPPGHGGSVSRAHGNDVLCGKGGKVNYHEGNIRFRDIVNDHKATYLAKTTRKVDKAIIAATIVNRIRALRPPGRFLKQDELSGQWVEIGDEKARKKAAQALREDAPKIRVAVEKEKEEEKKKAYIQAMMEAMIQLGAHPNNIPALVDLASISVGIDDNNNSNNNNTNNNTVNNTINNNTVNNTINNINTINNNSKEGQTVQPHPQPQSRKSPPVSSQMQNNQIQTHSQFDSQFEKQHPPAVYQDARIAQRYPQQQQPQQQQQQPSHFDDASFEPLDHNYKDLSDHSMTSEGDRLLKVLSEGERMEGLLTSSRSGETNNNLGNNNDNHSMMTTDTSSIDSATFQFLQDVSLPTHRKISQSSLTSSHNSRVSWADLEKWRQRNDNDSNKSNNSNRSNYNNNNNDISSESLSLKEKQEEMMKIDAWLQQKKQVVESIAMTMSNQNQTPKTTSKGILHHAQPDLPYQPLPPPPLPHPHQHQPQPQQQQQQQQQQYHSPIDIDYDGRADLLQPQQQQQHAPQHPQHHHHLPPPPPPPPLVNQVINLNHNPSQRSIGMSTIGMSTVTSATNSLLSMSIGEHEIMNMGDDSVHKLVMDDGELSGITGTSSLKREFLEFIRNKKNAKKIAAKRKSGSTSSSLSLGASTLSSDKPSSPTHSTTNNSDNNNNNDNNNDNNRTLTSSAAAATTNTNTTDADDYYNQTFHLHQQNQQEQTTQFQNEVMDHVLNGQARTLLHHSSSTYKHNHHQYHHHPNNNNNKTTSTPTNPHLSQDDMNEVNQWVNQSLRSLISDLSSDIMSVDQLSKAGASATSGAVNTTPPQATQPAPPTQPTHPPVYQTSSAQYHLSSQTTTSLSSPQPQHPTNTAPNINIPNTTQPQSMQQ